MSDGGTESRKGENRILTVPNLISFIRFLLIPTFLVVYLGYGQTTIGFVIFAFAAATDWVDGVVARSTNAVTKLGTVLDPLVDRLLIFSGVLAIVLVGRLPLWILILIVLRDLMLLVLTLHLSSAHGNRLTVVFVGKVATAVIMVGFCMLLLNWPIVPGLGIAEISWLPGFGAARCSAGILVVYIGLVLQWITAAFYMYRGLRYGTTAKVIKHADGTFEPLVDASISSDANKGSETSRSRVRDDSSKTVSDAVRSNADVDESESESNG